MTSKAKEEQDSVYPVISRMIPKRAGTAFAIGYAMSILGGILSAAIGVRYAILPIMLALGYFLWAAGSLAAGKSE